MGLISPCCATLLLKCLADDTGLRCLFLGLTVYSLLEDLIVVVIDKENRTELFFSLILFLL